MLQLNIARTFGRVARFNVVRSMSSDYGGHHHKSAVEVAKEHRTTLNDLPIPAGPWQEYYNKRNQGYTMMLIGGAIALIVTAACMYQTGTVSLHGPPDYRKLQINPK